MGRYQASLLVIMSLVGTSACGDLKTGATSSAPIFESAASAGQKESLPTVPAPSSVQSSASVIAQLSGYPSTKSPNAQYDINVSGVAEYKWKLVETASDCPIDAGYSAYVPAATPIKIDLASRSASPAIVAICVLGKSVSGELQTYPSLASWVWAPDIPGLSDQIDLIEGHNEIKISPKAPSGNWIIIRSRDPLNTLPEDGKEYAVNQTLGNGMIVAAGPMAEFIDKTVKNEESWTYTFVASSSARRYSLPLTRSMTLGKQELLWVPSNLIQPGQLPLEARANNKRYICRARHTDPATGQTRGLQPGAMITANNDLKAGSCFYEYGGAIYRSINYDLLMANKGNPVDMIRWVRGAASPTATTIPNGSILAGTDDTGATPGPGLYICLTINAQIPGKAGTHLPGGCRSYAGNNNGTPIVNVNFEVLAFK